MFTGLIEIIGTVSSIQEHDNTESGGNGWTITVSEAAEILTDCHLGDSIAINGMYIRFEKVSFFFPFTHSIYLGTCLTATEFDTDSFKVGVAPETLRCTNLGKFS
jgi:riboflavin synthase